MLHTPVGGCAEDLGVRELTIRRIFWSSQNPAQLTSETSFSFRDSFALHSWLIFHQEVGAGGWARALILYSFMLEMGRWGDGARNTQPSIHFIIIFLR